MSVLQDRVDVLEARSVLLEKTLSRAYEVLWNPAECICYEEARGDDCPHCDPIIVVRNEIREVLSNTAVVPSQKVAQARLEQAHAQGAEQMRVKAIDLLKRAYDFGVVGILQSINIDFPTVS